MVTTAHLEPQFVEFIPADLDDGVLYISVEYRTASHRCACGCGERVVTPISPEYWSFEFDGESVSLSPSIGNWDYACRSHYVVRRSRVRWARPWNQERIDRARAGEAAAVYESGDAPALAPPAVPAQRATRGWWCRLLGRGSDS